MLMTKQLLHAAVSAKRMAFPRDPSLMTKQFLIRALLGVAVIALPVMVMWVVQQRAAGIAQNRRPGKMLALEFINVQTADLDGDKSVVTFRNQVDSQTKTLGARHPETLMSRNNLANALIARGELKEAEAAQRVLLEDMAGVLSPGHPDIFRCRFNLALNLFQQGRLDLSRDEMEAAYEGWRRVLGEGHPRTLAARMMLLSIPAR